MVDIQDIFWSKEMGEPKFWNRDRAILYLNLFLVLVNKDRERLKDK